MTIQFPDVSEYDGQVSLHGAPVAIARATIGNVTDSQYDWYVQNAHINGVPLVAYHFLNSPSLGVSVTSQAAYAHSVIGVAPTMLDVETNRGASATLSDALAWVTAYRSLGGICHLVYFPHWYWQQLDSPDLTGFTSLGVNLVSSNYTSYSDSGPGWSGYGGVTPVQWQYTDAGTFNGAKLDMNAYKGTADEYWTMVGGTTMAMADDIALIRDKIENWIDPRTEAFGVGADTDLRGTAKGQAHWGVQTLKTLKATSDGISAKLDSLANTSGGLTDVDRQAIKDLTDAVNALNSRLATP